MSEKTDLDQMISDLDMMEDKKCKNCKKSKNVYNFKKTFIGYSCSDKLFKERVDPFPRGFGCEKFKRCNK